MSLNINRGDQSLVKRLVPVVGVPDGRPSAIKILSDNHAYPPDAVLGEEMNDLRAVGRVRGILTTI